ncbi:MAG: class II fructose-bisphosphate aldolase [Bacillales bacterium]|jgi:fructose-bisphosphate aldolase class II|nr:class II fructose-bisphosphate aldolase [Bacillales bacterium]
MLVTLKKVLEYAEKNKVAIGSFNTPNLESLRAVIEASEQLKQPVIVQFAQCHESLTPLKIIGPIMVALAKSAKVDVCVHLDHGETLKYLKQALEIGFTSIMYDGSNLKYEENVLNTIKAVEMAHKYGASVEAELGSMGARESGSSESINDTTKIYTDPLLSKDFIERTKIDALACSFGTVHGIYLTKPQLDFNIVREIREINNLIPIVMHGGSGVSKEDYFKAIEAGVRKINYFTYMDLAGGSFIKEIDLTKNVYFSNISLEAKEKMKLDVIRAMTLFARREK